jgi:hypothetical protein
VFDEFRQTFFVGEMVWNFADFMTAQGMFYASALRVSCLLKLKVKNVRRDAGTVHFSVFFGSKSENLSVY